MIWVVAKMLPSMAMPGMGIRAILAPANARAASGARTTPLIPPLGHGNPKAFTTAPDSAASRQISCSRSSPPTTAIVSRCQSGEYVRLTGCHVSVRSVTNAE